MAGVPRPAPGRQAGNRNSGGGWLAATPTIPNCLGHWRSLRPASALLQSWAVQGTRVSWGQKQHTCPSFVCSLPGYPAPRCLLQAGEQELEEESYPPLMLSPAKINNPYSPSLQPLVRGAEAALGLSSMPALANDSSSERQVPYPRT